MTRKIVYGIAIIAALAVLTPAGGVFVGGISGTAVAERADSEFESALLVRIEKLEQELAERGTAENVSAAGKQTKDESSQTAPDYSEQLNSMAQSLATIAEKAETADRIADSLASIVERLAAIEEELAWYRMDRMEEKDKPSGEGEAEPPGAN